MKRIFLALLVLSIALIGVSCVSAASDVDIASDHSNCGDFGVSFDHCDSSGLSCSPDDRWPDRPIGSGLGPINPVPPFGPVNPKK